MTNPNATFADFKITPDTSGKSQWYSWYSKVSGLERLEQLQTWIVSAWSPTSVSLDRLPETSPDSLSHRIRNGLSAQLHLLRLRHQISQERKDLSSLPDHLLYDIGISRNSANAEAVRKFNDIPVNRVARDLL